MLVLLFVFYFMVFLIFYEFYVFYGFSGYYGYCDFVALLGKNAFFPGTCAFNSMFQYFSIALDIIYTLDLNHHRLVKSSRFLLPLQEIRFLDRFLIIFNFICSVELGKLKYETFPNSLSLLFLVFACFLVVLLLSLEYFFVWLRNIINNLIYRWSTADFFEAVSRELGNWLGKMLNFY